MLKIFTRTYSRTLKTITNWLKIDTMAWSNLEFVIRTLRNSFKWSRKRWWLYSALRILGSSQCKWRYQLWAKGSQYNVKELRAKSKITNTFRRDIMTFAEELDRFLCKHQWVPKVSLIKWIILHEFRVVKNFV